MKVLPAIFGLLLSAVCAIGQVTLPVKRVVLYKTGIGYFELSGAVENTQPVQVAFTSGQLNDVLKSITVLDLNGGRIANINYESAPSAARQLSDVRLPIPEKAGLAEILGALRGARIEIRSGAQVLAGRLLSLERKTRISGGTTLEVDYVGLLTETGEVRTTELTPTFSVRLLDKDLSGKLDRYLDIASLSRAPDQRQMSFTAMGTGRRTLHMSYISEVPVWKSTYRIVLRAAKPPLLQGWAIVDNTTAQDWRGVQLSLVAGAPQSFVQDVSQPFYTRRPVVPLPQYAQAAPQTFEATLVSGGGQVAGTVTDPAGLTLAGARVRVFSYSGRLLGEGVTNGRGEYQVAGLAAGPVRIEVETPGFRTGMRDGLVVSSQSVTRQDFQLQVGSVAESVEVRAKPPQLQTESSAASTNYPFLSRPRTVEQAREQTQSLAEAQTLGDLFEYRLTEPVTIRQKESALVPIVNSQVEAEKVTVWNNGAGAVRPQRALWLTNSSGDTLDGGSFSIVDGEVFAGEGIVESMRPGEKRLLAYAADLAITGAAERVSDDRQTLRYVVRDGALIQERVLREKTTYTFRNADTTPRTMVVEHARRSGYEVHGPAAPAETTPNWLRFRVPVPSQQTAVHVVEETLPVETRLSLYDLDTRQVELFLQAREITLELAAGLRRVMDQNRVIAQLSVKLDALKKEEEAIDEDQQRLRENLKSLKGSAEEKALTLRYTQNLDRQESRLEAIRKEVQQLEQEREKAEEARHGLIDALPKP